MSTEIIINNDMLFLLANRAEEISRDEVLVNCKMSRGLAWYLALYYHCRANGMELPVSFDLTVGNRRYIIKEKKKEKSCQPVKRKRK